MLKQAVASKAAKLKQEINDKLQNKAYVGIIKSMSISSITLASETNTKLVTVNQDTVYEGKRPKEENYIAALGDIDETATLTAKKVVLLSLDVKSEQAKTYLWGQIISTSDELITLKDKESKILSVSTAKINTKFKNGDFVIITGYLSKNKILEASFLHIIPQGVILKPKFKESTPSATKSGKSS